MTVVIPCYNPDPDHLAEAVRSVLASTFPPVEVILIDDGTTGPVSLAAIQSWATKPGLRVITHPENRGLSAARNTGMAAATTELVLQLDADDRIDPTFLEKAAWALTCHPEWAFVNAWVRAFGAREYVWTRGFDAGRDFLADNQTNPVAVIRRAVDRAVGGHDETIRGGMEDWDYWLKMANHGHWGGTIREVLIDYRIHPEPTYWPNRDHPDMRLRFRRDLRKRYPRLWRDRFPVPRHEPQFVPNQVIAPGVLPKQTDDRAVLIVAPWLALGGADRFNLNLTQQLAGLGYRVTIATTIESPDPWRGAFQAHTTDIFSLPKFLTPEYQAPFLRSLIETRGIGVVLISNSMLGYAALPFLRAYCPQTAFVDYNHMVVTEWLNGGFVRVGVESQKQLDLNLVNAGQVRDWMVQEGADPNRIDVVYMGQDCTVLDPARYDRDAARAQFGVTDDTAVLLFPARLDPQKRPRFLLQILSRLKDERLRFLCLIAGDGPQRGLVEAGIRRYRLGDQVRLLGMLPAEEMPGLYAAADLIVLPTQNEGIALALFEGMAMGLPVVAAAVGGQPELVTDEAGILVPQDSNELDAYVEALTSLVSDPAKRRAMGAAARQRMLSAFNIQLMTDQMINAFGRARRFNTAEPRTRLTAAEAHPLTEQLADDIRHERLQERLRSGHLDPAHADAAASARWRGWVYLAKKNVFRPTYYWAIRHGFDFVIPLVGRIYRRFSWFLK